MTTDLQTILGELYDLDPSLRDHEKDLIPILEKMIATKPDAQPDPAFIEHLRMLLREKAHSPSNFQFSIFNFPFLSMRNLQYTLTGLLIGVIVAAPVTYSLTQSGGLPMTTTDSDSTQKLFSYSVEDTGSEAFGDLSTMPMNPAYGQGGAEGAPAMDMTMTSRPQSGGGGGDVAVDRMMIAPEMTQYRLTFEGALPELSSSVDVYNRIKGGSDADLSKILGSFNTGLIDLSSFRGAKTDMISFYQDTAYGYTVNVSFREGWVNINQNWEKWPHPESTCQDEACYQRYRIKASDVPADEVLLAAAADFVAAHDIDMAQYGQPEVDRQWRMQYEAAADKTSVWIPDSVRVIYPLLIDGKPVFDEGGMKAGISLGVNVREKKVSDVWGIMDQKYRKSAYAGVTDEVAIRTYLQNYGRFGVQYMGDGSTVKDVQITLGTPEVSLVRMYNYRENTSEELLVPALVFPVTNVPAGEYYYNQSITIPLASELFDQRNNQGEPIPMPMPLMMEDAVRAEEAIGE